MLHKMDYQVKHSIVIILLSFLFVNCAGNYDLEFNHESQIAVIYLGAKGGNRILYLNSPKFPQLSRSRKKSYDSTYIFITNLEINPISLRHRIGDNGPGFAYDWNDADDISIESRYKLVALDDSSNIIIELKNIYAIKGMNGEWKHLKE